MPAFFQTAAAFAIVILAAAGLVWRAVARRHKHGCSSCPPDEFKVKLKR